MNSFSNHIRALFNSFWTVFLLFVCFCQVTAKGQQYTGDGTFYGYGGGGNCSLPYNGKPVYTGAMNQVQYDSSYICGACVEVTGARGSFVISIEDRCPECKYGDIDLSEEVFPIIDDPVKGRVPISWKIVPCPVTGALQFYIKEGSSQWWTAIQVRNSTYPIQSLEYMVNGSWVNIHRENYNYFLVASGMGAGPYSLRITDMCGQQIIENNIPLIDTTVINGTQQFSPKYSTTDSCPQSIKLSKGWNLISFNIAPANQSTKTVFKDALANLIEIKNDTAFWRKDMDSTFNSLNTITGGNAYLVNMNEIATVSTPGTLTLNTGTPIAVGHGWNLVGCPFFLKTTISTVFDLTKIKTIKDFEDYWQSTGSGTLQYIEPGKGYIVNGN